MYPPSSHFDNRQLPHQSSDTSSNNESFHLPSIHTFINPNNNQPQPHHSYPSPHYPFSSPFLSANTATTSNSTNSRPRSQDSLMSGLSNFSNNTLHSNNVSGSFPYHHMVSSNHHDNNQQHYHQMEDESPTCISCSSTTEASPQLSNNITNRTQRSNSSMNQLNRKAVMTPNGINLPPSLSSSNLHHSNNNSNNHPYPPVVTTPLSNGSSPTCNSTSSSQQVLQYQQQQLQTSTFPPNQSFNNSNNTTATSTTYQSSSSQPPQHYNHINHHQHQPNSSNHHHHNSAITTTSATIHHQPLNAHVVVHQHHHSTTNTNHYYNHQHQQHSHHQQQPVSFYNNQHQQHSLVGVGASVNYHVPTTTTTTTTTHGDESDGGRCVHPHHYPPLPPNKPTRPVPISNISYSGELNKDNHHQNNNNHTLSSSNSNNSNSNNTNNGNQNSQSLPWDNSGKTIKSFSNFQPKPPKKTKSSIKQCENPKCGATDTPLWRDVNELVSIEPWILCCACERYMHRKCVQQAGIALPKSQSHQHISQSFNDQFYCDECGGSKNSNIMNTLNNSQENATASTLIEKSDATMEEQMDETPFDSSSPILNAINSSTSPPKSNRPLSFQAPPSTAQVRVAARPFTVSAGRENVVSLLMRHNETVGIMNSPNPFVNNIEEGEYSSHEQNSGLNGYYNLKNRPLPPIPSNNGKVFSEPLLTSTMPTVNSTGTLSNMREGNTLPSINFLLTPPKD